MSTQIRMFVWLTLLTGVLYPLLITGIAQVAMNPQAEGGLIKVEGKVVGAQLIGQAFSKENYFWGRPSFVGYDAKQSGGSNWSQTNLKLQEAVEARKNALAKAHAGKEPPSDLLYASGSGLDPHITLSTAYYQLERVAQARSLDTNMLKELVDSISTRSIFLREPYVNVLLLNRRLDERR